MGSNSERINSLPLLQVKTVSSILTLYFLFLIVQPLLGQFESSKSETCCSNCCEGDDSGNTSSSDEQGKGCTDACNPLLSCNSCLGFVVPSTLQAITPVELTRTIVPVYSETTPISISIGFWQPPKIS